MATYELTNLKDVKSASDARWKLEYDFDKAGKVGWFSTALPFWP